MKLLITGLTLIILSFSYSGGAKAEEEFDFSKSEQSKNCNTVTLSWINSVRSELSLSKMKQYFVMGEYYFMVAKKRPQPESLKGYQGLLSRQARSLESHDRAFTKKLSELEEKNQTAEYAKCVSKIVDLQRELVAAANSFTEDAQRIERFRNLAELADSRNQNRGSESLQDELTEHSTQRQRYPGLTYRR